MVKLKKGAEIIYGEREYASEALGGFIITLIALFFAPFGLELDIIFSFIGLLVLVPVYKIVFNWFIFEAQSSIKYVGIKYISGIASVIFVSIVEAIDPTIVVLTLIIGVLIYIFMDDITSMVGASKVTW